MLDDGQRRTLDPEHDTAAFKALTHPLRIRLLGLLRQDGPATASELAARTGESSGTTSYHLRVLAKYAFVAEAEHRDARERRWRAVHLITSWDARAVSATPESRAFVEFSRREQVDHLARSLARHEEDVASGRLDGTWAATAGIDDLVLRLSPDSLAELRALVHRRALELAERDQDAPGTEQVVLVTAAIPLAAPGGAG
ncbi:helix-turn-helix domain-containing protein [Kitasatospora sp. NPDC057500]|uniref:helix-turn-helix domain-containing protein n=1 Tax=Kitasatospora sp. NPDC057500 TaxID=3346151 RepID=UPI00369B5735